MASLDLHTDAAGLFAWLAAPERATAVFLEAAAHRITYARLTERTRKLATLFREHGLREGDRVMVSVADEVETALLFLALLGNGLTAILLDPEAKPHRAASIIETAQPDAIIADETFFERVPSARSASFAPKKGQLFRKLLGQSAQPVAADTYPALLADLPLGTLPDQIDPETVAYVLFTSGTTADTKGVQITHRSLFAHLDTLSRVYGLDGGSRLLNNLLLYHADGMIQGPVLAAYLGIPCIRPLSFEINRIGELLDAVYKHRISHFVAVPTMLTLIQRFADGYEDSFQ